MKAIPEKSEAGVSSSGTRPGCPSRTSAMRTAPTRNSAATVTYTVAAPRPYSAPPSAGPRMRAVWPADVTLAMARGRRASGTSRGISAARAGFSNARAAPSIAARARMPSRPSQPPRLPSASATATAAWATSQMTTTRRRS